MRSGLRKVLLFAAALSFSTNVQAANWSTSQKDWRHNGVVTDDSSREGMELQWNTASQLSNFQQPLFFEGKIFLLEYSNSVSSIWAARAMDKISGKELWRTSGIGPIRPNFVVADNYVVIPAKKLIVLNSETGQQLWEASDLPNYSFWYPSIENNKLFVVSKPITGGNDSYVQAFNLLNGTSLWRQYLSAYGLSGISHFKDQIIITSNDASNHTKLDCFDQSSGTLRWSYSRSYNPSGAIVVDESNGFGFVSSGGGVVTQVNLNTGTKIRENNIGYNSTVTLLIDDKSYYLNNSLNSVYLNGFDINNGEVLARKKITSDFTISYASNPIFVSDRIFFATPSGDLMSVKLDGTDTKRVPVTTENLVGLSYADGVFIAMNSAMNKVFVISSMPLLAKAETHVELDSPYKADGEYHEYLGQIHSHYKPDVPKWSKVFNGEPTPAYTEQKYKDAGYDFVALTEHNEITSDPGVAGILHIGDAEEDTQEAGGNHILALGISNTIDESGSAQERINAVRSQGGVAILPHPNSKDYAWSLKELLQVSGESGVEVFNGASFFWRSLSTRLGNFEATDKLDNFLANNKKVWLAAGDDYTPGDGGFDNAAIVVRAKNLNQAEILQNITVGNFYAIQGSKAPRLNILTSNNKITATSNLDGTIKFIGKNGKELKHEDNTLVSTYMPTGDEIYVRIEARANGKTAWSQPIFVSNTGTANITLSGNYSTDLDQAKLLVKNTGAISASILPFRQYPTQLPPLGYISPVYSISTLNQPQSGGKLSIDYSDKQILTNEQNLSIYAYDSPTSSWSKLSSAVDITNKTVTTNLPSITTEAVLFALSADEPEDLESPIIDLTSPASLIGLVGEVLIEISAVDNNAVIQTGIYIDDELVCIDSDVDDGWKFDLDMNNFFPGNHKLQITAEDLSGNIGAKEFDFSINGSSFVRPQINITTPSENQKVSGKSQITGSFQSESEVESISLWLDEVFIGEAVLGEAEYNKEVDWQQYKTGLHQLKAKFTNANGEVAETSANINISEEITLNEFKLQIRQYFVEKKITNVFTYLGLVARATLAEYWQTRDNKTKRNQIYNAMTVYIQAQNSIRDDAKLSLIDNIGRLILSER